MAKVLTLKAFVACDGSNSVLDYCFNIFLGVDYIPRSDMWTLLLVLASTVLLVEPYQDFGPLHYPPITTTITCMIPGPYESRKRSALPPGRVPVPEPIFTLSLQPKQADECWELPEIAVKEPYRPPGSLQFNISLNNILNTFLDPTPLMVMITSNVDGALVVPGAINALLNVSLLPYQIPDRFLAGFSDGDQITIRRYLATLDIGECDVNFQVVERPKFYYPRYQVQGCCSGNDCSLPPTDEHDFVHKCRSFVGGADQVYIRALRWDCCQSYTIQQEWVEICGWRQVRFPVVHKCECSCDSTEQ